jgi:hypothetical protein
LYDSKIGSARKKDDMDEKPTSKHDYPEPTSRWEERRQRRASRGSSTGTLVFGAILILLGIAFLLQTLGIFDLDNWWALFIMLPAVGAFESAWREYKDAGSRLNSKARGSLILGFILTMVTAVLLFELNWSVLGPILIILAGIAILTNALLPGDSG